MQLATRNATLLGRVPILRGLHQEGPAAVEYMGMGQNPIPLVNIKIAGKWMFIPLKMVCIGIDP